MTTPNNSRTSLGEVISLISLADLTGREKADLTSAIRAVARILSADPDSITADAGALRRRLETVAPAAHGMSVGRWANVRSLLGKALALVRPMVPGRSVHPLLPEWQALVDGLRRNRKDQLLAMLRFLSKEGLRPRTVTLADLETYHQAMLNDRLRRRPEQTWDHLVWAWNACRREIPNWPSVEIPRTPRREIYSLPWSSFPDSLQREVERFIERQSGKDLSEDGPPRPLRPLSLRARKYQLRLAASALVLSGHEAQSLTSLAVVLQFDNFRTILQFFLDRHGGETSTQVEQLASFFKSVVRHWLKIGGAELERYGKMASRLAMPKTGMVSKNRERLRPFDDDETVGRLHAVPSRIRADVERLKLIARRKAHLAQRAAAVAILLVAPIRAFNLAQLDVERHLVARGKRLYIVIPEREVKNRQPIDFELPEDTAELVAWYTRDHRPHLLMGPSTALFPGAAGKAKSTAGLATQVSRVVFQYTGLKVNVHLFRHIAAKTYLDRHPGDYATIQRLLGHKSLSTTLNAYTGEETRAAGRHFVDVIRRRRGGDGT